MVAVFREVKRVLRDDGTVWANLGSSYWGGKGQSGKASPEKQGDGTHAVFKPKDLVMIPAMVALALQADGWWLRSEITWAKKAPMPSSVTDRPTTATEKIYLLTKQARYYYDQEAVREGEPSLTGRSMWNYWLLGPEPYQGAHFAVFPTEIPRRAIKAGSSEKGCCPECGSPWVRVVETRRVPYQYKNGPGGRQALGDLSPSSCFNTNLVPVSTTTGWQPSCDCGHEDTVPCRILDPFCGSGTTGVVCQELGRDFVGLDLSWDYLQLARERTGAKALDEWENGITDDSDLSDLPMFAI